MNARTLAALSITVLASACATPGTTRDMLSQDQVEEVKPEIRVHASCVAERVNAYLQSSRDVRLVVDTALGSCRKALQPLARKLDAMDLTLKARVDFLRVVENTARTVLSDRLLSGTGTKPPGGARPTREPSISL